MHLSAMKNGKRFFDAYAQALPAAKVVEIGSQILRGSLRDVSPAQFDYVGVDFVAAWGVDVVLDDPYKLPLADESADIVVSSSVFEHSEMFWLLFLEIVRILKPAGLFYLNAPSNGPFHRYPVDCWRFYPESGPALVTWARRNGYDPLLLESFISDQDNDYWNDYVAVFLKDQQYVGNYPHRISDTKIDLRNGIVHAREGFVNPKVLQENEEKLEILQHLATPKQ